MTKVLITGAGGYIGSTLVPMIRNLHPDWRVTALDNWMYGVPSLAASAGDPGVQFVRGDARDLALMAKLLLGADVVIPLAAIVGMPACDADLTACWTTNSGAVKLICEHAAPDTRIVIPITNSGYGIGAQGVECTEESPLNPLSQYGEAKVDAERAVMERGNAVALRLATVFGFSPRMRMDLLVNDFVWKALTERCLTLFEPHAMRNYIHVRDVALAFIHVLNEWEDVRDNIFNVGDTDANCSKWDLACRIQTQLPEIEINESAKRTDPDKRDYIVSNAKFERTGWKPQYTLDDGIRELINGYRMFKRVEHGNT